MTMREDIIDALKKDWLSNFQLQIKFQSSSADRTARNIRENPPTGYKVIQRLKDLPKGYNKCFEYRLVEVANEEFSEQ